MTLMKIGLQLFTVRKQAQADLYGTLRRLSEMGIKYIEAARIPFDKLSADAFVRAEGELDTKVIAAQIKFSELTGNFDGVMSFLKAVRCRAAVISVLPTEYILGSDCRLPEFAAAADALAEKYADNGVALCYHHHDFEFLKSGGGTRYDIIIENMKRVKLVLDTFWLTKAGISAVKLIEANKGRVEGLHLRDYALTRRLASRIPKDFAVGDGVVDFKDIIDCAERCGAAYGAIEQNTKTPFEEISKSADFLRGLGYADMFKIQ